MTNPIIDLCSTSAIYEAVATFDIATLSVRFDSQYVISNEDIFDVPEENIDPATVLQHVPTPVLVHEIGHIWQAATTPAGLRDFFNSFVAEFNVRKVVTEAARIADRRLPVGLYRTLNNSNGPESLTSAYQQALALYNHMAFRIGGLRFPIGLYNDTDSPGRFKDGHFFATHDDVSSQVCTLLGVRHIYEGFGAIAELRRLATERPLEQRDFPPTDPYMICYQIYRNRKADASSEIRDSPVELAAILDTALMLDEWMAGMPSEYTPAQSFFRILDILRDRPELELGGESDEDIVHFQDGLLSAIGAPTPSVSAICASLIEFLPDLTDEINACSSVPEWMIEGYIRSIRWFLRTRLEILDGACPINFLTYASRPTLGELLNAFPQTGTGIVVPVTQGNQDMHDLFASQAPPHLRPAIEEIVFGRRPCPVVDRCVLPRRPACNGVTDQFVPDDERCPREAVISRALSDLQIDELIFD